jgi:glutaredoxin
MTNWASLRSLAIVVLLVWGGSQALSWWQDRRFAEAVRLGSQQHELVVFSTDTCPYCARARTWLNAQDVRWRECHVEHDAACQEAYQAQGAPGVPLVRVGSAESGAGVLWNLGFSPAWVASAMAKLDAQQPAAQGPAQRPAHRPSADTSPRP